MDGFLDYMPFVFINGFSESEIIIVYVHTFYRFKTFIGRLIRFDEPLIS